MVMLQYLGDIWRGKNKQFTHSLSGCGATVEFVLLCWGAPEEKKKLYFLRVLTLQKSASAFSSFLLDFLKAFICAPHFPDVIECFCERRELKKQDSNVVL